jgi:Kdo2-lipid IVA lauroyltransferase/acyltransferase
VAVPKLRAFRNRSLFRAILVISFIGRRVPLSLGRRLGRFVGDLAWRVARRHRRKSLQNVAVAFPDLTASQRSDIVRSMFQHLGMSLFEIVWLPKMDAKSFARTTVLEGFEAVRAIVQNGDPVIIFTGHCGNWEWTAASIARGGVPLTVLQRERDEGGLNDFITNIRAASGIKTIDRGSSASGRDLIHALRRGTAIGFLIDQSLRVESVKVPFFGKPALTPIGPAKMAIRAEAHACTIFGERRPDGKHVVRFSEPVPLRRDDDAVALTALMTRAIEDQIRRFPEQWVWMHDRWKERPKWEAK